MSARSQSSPKISQLGKAISLSQNNEHKSFTLVQKGERVSPATEIQKGQRLSPRTEFKPGEHWRPKRRHWDKEYLTEQYVTLKRSMAEIAADNLCTERTSNTGCGSIRYRADPSVKPVQ